MEPCNPPLHRGHYRDPLPPGCRFLSVAERAALQLAEAEAVRCGGPCGQLPQAPGLWSLHVPGSSQCVGSSAAGPGWLALAVALLPACGL